MSIKRKNKFNTVTPFSKTLAMILFITLPFVGFYLGIQFEKRTAPPPNEETARNSVSFPVLSEQEKNELPPLATYQDADHGVYLKYPQSYYMKSLPPNPDELEKSSTTLFFQSTIILLLSKKLIV